MSKTPIDETVLNEAAAIPADPENPARVANDNTTKSAGDDAVAQTSGEAVLDVEEPDSPFPVLDMLRTVSQRHNKPMPAIVWEITKLASGIGRITPEDYFGLRLFDDEQLRGEDKTKFLGLRGARKIALDINKNCPSSGIAGNKIAFNTLLGGYGLPVIKTHAFYHGRKKFPGMNFLGDAAALRGYLTAPGSLPVFGKPSNSSLSLGTVGIMAYDADTDTLSLSDGRNVPVDELIATITDNFGTGYLFQELVEPHADVAKLCGRHIPTIRVVTLNDRDGIKIFRATWKIVAGQNMADNFWRKGNLLAAIDPETGVIERVVRGANIHEEQVECHPDTGAKLVGAHVPGWASVVEAVKWGATMFDDISMIGWDVAPSARGPLLVEANDAPDLRLVQYAQKKGAYTDAFKDFVEYRRELRDEKRSKMKERGQARDKKMRDKMIASLKKTG